MHPMFAWWKRARGGCGGFAAAGCGPGDDEGRSHGHGHHGHGHGYRERAHYFFNEHFGEGGAGFGVRRPLRFLAYKLELDDTQVAELARILNELKTERAQAEVDGRRTVTAFADAVSSGEFDESKANEGGELRVGSATRLREAVLKALRQVHGILNDEQRKQLAYLIRTGAVTL